MFVLFPSIKDGVGQRTQPEAAKVPGAKHLWVVCLPLSFFPHHQSCCRISYIIYFEGIRQVFTNGYKFHKQPINVEEAQCCDVQWKVYTRFSFQQMIMCLRVSAGPYMCLFPFTSLLSVKYLHVFLSMFPCVSGGRREGGLSATGADHMNRNTSSWGCQLGNTLHPYWSAPCSATLLLRLSLVYAHLCNPLPFSTGYVYCLILLDLAP